LKQSDLEELKIILQETTEVFSSGEVKVSKRIKCFNFGSRGTVGVDEDRARDFRLDLLRVLNNFPQPERQFLAEGRPSQEELEKVLRDKGATLQLIALLLFFGFWTHESVFCSK